MISRIISLISPGQRIKTRELLRLRHSRDLFEQVDRPSWFRSTPIGEENPSRRAQRTPGLAARATLPRWMHAENRIVHVLFGCYNLRPKMSAHGATNKPEGKNMQLIQTVLSVGDLA